MEMNINFPDFNLSGRKALVTGASRGIGRALALGLVNAGAKVTLTGREEKTLAEVAGQIETLGGNAVVQRMDVRDTDDIRQGINASTRRMDGLDILINNAGFESVSDSFEVTSDLWDTILETNLKGAFFCAQAAGEKMAAVGGGAIVNVCSLTSSVGVATAVPYTSSKSGLLGMTRALATEWAACGIRVNAIAPGYFHTAMTDPFFQNGDWAERMKAKIPLARFGHVQDLIGPTVFLCSKAAEYITGQMITIDGGYLASI
jgi:NAD(P)-dependent dehydrogenase (short-subunit alcohol dehydrogenase family)